MIKRRGKPGMMLIRQWDRVHLERHVRLGMQDNRVVWHFIAPGKPMQNGFDLPLNFHPKAIRASAGF